MSGSAPVATQFKKSYFHTPGELSQRVFVSVLRAGHLKAAPDYRVERRICAGHDLLLCINGRGSIQTMGKVYGVKSGQLAWLNGHHPHAHWASPEDPWELLWVRVDGHTLSKLSAALWVEESPVFELPDLRRVRRHFDRILSLMKENSHVLEAQLHAELACLVAALFEVRQSADHLLPGAGPEVAEGMRRSIEQMCIYHYRPWRVEELARLAGMSVAHYFRCFRRVTGLTPIVWLLRERMTQAKRHLVESDDSIKQIAEQVGYSDQFHFSRDFKRSTGIPPSEYRRRERH